MSEILWMIIVVFAFAVGGAIGEQRGESLTERLIFACQRVDGMLMYNDKNKLVCVSRGTSLL